MILKLFFLCVTLLFDLEAAALNSRLRKTNPGAKLNVCRQLQDYFSGATNANECWYNPDVDGHAHDIIKRYGYFFESYKVTSEDNYITTLFRIPRGKRDAAKKQRQPVFLLHGLATSSHIMVDIGKRSLAFTLADAGYDVWLGNLRGSTYSVGHTNLSYVNNDYWHFSFHEMGKYDMPVSLQFIANKTKGSIIFIGHSVAASVFHVFEDYHRELSKKVLKVAVLVAPVVYLDNLKPIHKELEKFGNPLMTFATLLGVNDNSTFASTILDQTSKICGKKMPPMLGACANGFYVSFGLRANNIPAHYIPLMLAHNPSGFAVNTVNHLLQIANNDGLFQEYDFGVEKNRQIYDDVFPREYDVQDCATPVIVFYGAEDWLSTEKDIDRLLKAIPKDKVKGKFKIKSDVWKHMDYFYGKNADKLFYKPLLENLKKFKQEAPAEKEPAKEEAKNSTTTANGEKSTTPNSDKATTVPSSTDTNNATATEPSTNSPAEPITSTAHATTTPEGVTTAVKTTVTPATLPTMFPEEKS